LQVEDQGVETLQHFVGGAARVAVEAEELQACGGIGGVSDFGVDLAGDAVLGAEERDKFYIVRVGEDVNRAAALRVHPCLIGDQADAFAAQWREILLFEDVNAGFRLLGGLRQRGRR
jgi:hypothetical protein